LRLNVGFSGNGTLPAGFAISIAWREDAPAKLSGLECSPATAGASPAGKETVWIALRYSQTPPGS